MAAQLYAFTCGHLTLPLGFLLAGREGTIKVPVTSYLIAHPRGRIVFDSGLHPHTQHDPVGHVGEMLAALHDFDFREGEDIGSRLRSIDIDPASITHIVNSHLHFDHCGGNRELAEAAVVTQRIEWEVGKDAGPRHGYVSADFDTGQTVQLLDGEHDLLGDGSVVCFPTHGHTPGHQSVRVRTEQGGEFILCGDACYLKHSLDELALPGIVADRNRALESLHLFRKLRDSGARIMYGHDPEFWQTIPQAPVRLG